MTSKFFLKLMMFDISEEEIKLLKKNKPFSRTIYIKKEETKKFEKINIDDLFSQLNNQKSFKLKPHRLSSFEEYYSELLKFIKNKKISVVCIILNCKSEKFISYCKKNNLFISEEHIFDSSILEKMDKYIRNRAYQEYLISKNDFEIRNNIKYVKKRDVKVLTDKEKLTREKDAYKFNKSVKIIPKGYYQ